ncbi:MAG: hypothetical protein WDN44_13145 [Sphingomonas sp.]
MARRPKEVFEWRRRPRIRNHRSRRCSIAGALDGEAVLRLADRIAALHERADAGDGATAAAFRRLVAEDAAGSPAAAREFEQLAERLESRLGMGRARRIADERQAPVDVLYDLALPLMEMARSGLGVQANMLANRYVDVAPQGASGWALLPLFVALRAIRAGDAAFADEVLRPAPPRLIAIGGLSGTGKTTLARLIGSRLGRPPARACCAATSSASASPGCLPKRRCRPPPIPAGATRRRSRRCSNRRRTICAMEAA